MGSHRRTGAHPLNVESVMLSALGYTRAPEKAGCVKGLIRIVASGQIVALWISHAFTSAR